jgi:hypothetical protein
VQGQDGVVPVMRTRQQDFQLQVREFLVQALDFAGDFLSQGLVLFIQAQQPEVLNLLVAKLQPVENVDSPP